MYVLNKNRIMIIISIVMVGIFSFSIQTNTNEDKSAVHTVAVPVTSKVIVLDAGHGGEDEGGSLLH